jgi:DeoR family glycerol-3-phosphate regulon repressor
VVRVEQAIIASSRQVFLAADHTKFGRNAMVRLGGMDDIDALFTDAAPPLPLRERIEAADVALFVADQELARAG